MRRIALAIWLVGCGGAMHAPTTHAPDWRDATPDSFAEATRTDRLVLLSVQADWCHWCHVMNATTYADPDVLALLASHFVVMRADADARPDLAERYTNYGWPATILFTADGREIVRIRGHRDPTAFRAILEDAIRDPRAEAIAADAHDDDLEAMRDRVRAQLDGLYDDAQDGWGREQKYPFGALVRHALFRARVGGDATQRDRGLRSLARHAELIDPIWGGMFQYSDHDWSDPHFEKLASIQAAAIASFADAYAATGDEAWLAHARDVTRYVRAFLTSDDGAFFASQDADLRVDGRDPIAGATYYALDDAHRRALGVPRIDTHVYPAVNGELAAALARLGDVARDEDAIAMARAAIARMPHDAEGLYRHDPADDAHYLADQAQMLAAFVAMHQATLERAWLARAASLADATLASFRDESGALRARAGDADPLTGTLHPIEENAIVAHALLMLARLEERDDREETALAILRGVASPTAVADLGRKVGAYAIALELASSGTVLFTIVGAADDARTIALVDAARRYDDPRRVLAMQTGEGTYPVEATPVVFVCGRGACSAPIESPDALAMHVDEFLGRVTE